jgi:hypothetical protein
VVRTTGRYSNGSGEKANAKGTGDEGGGEGRPASICGPLIGPAKRSQPPTFYFDNTSSQTTKTHVVNIWNSWVKIHEGNGISEYSMCKPALNSSDLIDG